MYAIKITDEPKQTRLEAYRKVLSDFSIDPEDDSYSGAEDAKEYLDGKAEIKRFCVVTMAGDFVYAKPHCSTFEEAKEEAVLYINDDIFPEAPRLIIDLDTGKQFAPSWSTLQWSEENACPECARSFGPHYQGQCEH